LDRTGELNRGTWIYELLIDGRLYDIQNDPNQDPLSNVFSAIREGDDLPFFLSTVIAKAGSNQEVTAGLSIVLDGSESSGPNTGHFSLNGRFWISLPTASRPSPTRIPYSRPLKEM